MVKLDGTYNREEVNYMGGCLGNAFSDNNNIWIIILIAVIILCCFCGD